MLTPEKLKEIPERFVQLIQDLEDHIIADIARRVGKEGMLTDMAILQTGKAVSLGADIEDIERLIQKTTNAALKDIDHMIRETIGDSIELDNAIYKRAGYDPIDLGRSAALTRILETGIRQTQKEFRNLTQSMGFVSMQGGKPSFLSLKRFYQDTLDMAALQVSTGVLDLNTAKRFAVKKMAESGLRIRIVEYASGHYNRADVAVRRAILTGVNQLNLRMTDSIMETLGAEYVETTAHMGARPDHQIWQGQVFHVDGAKDGYPDFVSSTGYGTGPGLGGWNCRHSYFAFFPGISTRAYTDERLRNIDPPPFTYDGKTYTYYQATQRQRELETAIRKTKRELVGYDAAGMKEDFTAASIKLNRQKELYKDFSKAAKIRMKPERHQEYGFGRSVAQKAVQANRKTVEKYAGYRYNEDGAVVVTDDWKSKGKTSIPKRYKPYAVIETKTVYRDGTEQIDRTIYGPDGRMELQLHPGDHNKRKQHPYGKAGEHKHVYIWDSEKIVRRITDELDDALRRLIGDLL